MDNSKLNKAPDQSTPNPPSSKNSWGKWAVIALLLFIAYGWSASVMENREQEKVVKEDMISIVEEMESHQQSLDKRIDEFSEIEDKPDDARNFKSDYGIVLNKLLNKSQKLDNEFLDKMSTMPDIQMLFREPTYDELNDINKLQEMKSGYLKLETLFKQYLVELNKLVKEFKNDVQSDKYELNEDFVTASIDSLDERLVELGNLVKEVSKYTEAEIAYLDFLIDNSDNYYFDEDGTPYFFDDELIDQYNTLLEITLDAENEYFKKMDEFTNSEDARMDDLKDELEANLIY